MPDPAKQTLLRQVYTSMQRKVKRNRHYDKMVDRDDLKADIENSYKRRRNTTLSKNDWQFAQMQSKLCDGAITIPTEYSIRATSGALSPELVPRDLPNMPRTQLASNRSSYLSSQVSFNPLYNKQSKDNNESL